MPTDVVDSRGLTNPKDGYTIGFGHLGTHVANGAIYKLNYDLVADLEPIVLLPSNPMIVVSKNAVPAKTLPELISGLAAAAAPASDVDLLSAQLGRLSFVHLRRCDVVAQAVSLAKSVQTHFWHPGEAVLPGGRDPHYDEELIGRLVATIERAEADWAAWTPSTSCPPCRIRYGHFMFSNTPRMSKGRVFSATAFIESAPNTHFMWLARP